MNKRLTFWILALIFVAGIALSILSLLEICVEHCSANQDYRLLNMPFPITGIAFFTGLLSLQLLSKSDRYLIFGLCAAAGAELMFIWIQKYSIGHWCPLCLSVAALVFAALAVKIFQHHNEGIKMKFIKSGSAAFFIIGFLVAFFGITKVNLVEAGIDEMKEKIVMGNKNSPIEIYVVTDWFCPSCRKVEPLIEKTLYEVQSKAAIYFIDYAIHKNSANFSPYNLAFLVNSKPEYFKARNLLSEISEKNESPTDAEIIKAAQKQNISLKELPYVEVKSGLDYFDKVVDQFDLNATPTIVIYNKNTKKNFKLDGSQEISAESIKKAMDNLNK